jgi:WD40 repeat protein
MNDNNGHSDPLFFKPEEVDTQIDRLSQPGAGEQDNVEFINYLRNLYTTRFQQEEPMLNAIWDRIERGIPEVRQKQNRMIHIMSVQNRQKTSSSLQQKAKSAFFTRLGNLVATILIVGIVGVSVVIFTLAHRQNTTTTAGHGISTSIATSGHTVPTPTVTISPSKQIGKVVYTSAAVPLGIYALNWSPDSKRVAIGTLQAESFDATTGNNVVMYGTEGSSSIGDVAWSPDGKQLAVTSITQTTVSIYNATTGELQDQYTESAQQARSAATPFIPMSFKSSQHPASTEGLGAGLTAWSPDGKRMATAFGGIEGNSIQIWDTSTKAMLQNYTKHADVVESLAWSPDGKYLLSSSVDGSTQIWDSLTGQRVLDIESHERGTNHTIWSPDGKTIAYSINSDVELLDATSGKVLLTHHQSNKQDSSVSVAWSPDGHSIASGNNQIDLWDVTTGKTYYTFTDNGQYIRDFRWSPDGKYIASYTTDSPDSKLQVWIAQ